MNLGKTVFSQLMSLLPDYEFNKCVARYNGDYRIKEFTCKEHFLIMSFAQLTYRDSLRDIESCLQAMSKKLYHSGIKRKNIFLIMITENTDFVIQCIRHGFYDYLLFNTLKADLKLFSDRLKAQSLLDSKSNVKNHILIKEHKANTELQYNNIVFIEAYGSYSNLYTENRFYTISKAIKSIIHNLPETFVRVHRSYAVNLDHVQSFNAEEVIMNNSTIIKISRTKKMALSEAIQKTA